MVAQFLIPVSLVAFQATPISVRADTSACSTVEQRAAEDVVQDEWITSLQVAATAPPQQLRGRRVSLRDVQVAQTDGPGFWIAAGTGGCQLFVDPAEGDLIHVTPGQLIDLLGEFRFRRARSGGAPSSRVPYVYAYIVRRYSPMPIRTAIAAM